MTKDELIDALDAAHARIAELESALEAAPVAGEAVERVEYPKALYSKDFDYAHPERGGVVLVQDEEEHAALGDGWCDSPAAFGIETHPEAKP